MGPRNWQHPTRPANQSGQFIRAAAFPKKKGANGLVERRIQGTVTASDRLAQRLRLLFIY
jgi:hypothetical protein